MAISTFNTFLAWGATPYGLSKKVVIKDFPDIGGAPELIETTTLEDAMQTYILGIQSSGSMEFTFNFTKSEYAAVAIGAKTDMYYAISFGNSGIFRWQGKHDIYLTGKGVNEVVEAKIVIAPSTKPEYSDMGALLVSCADATGAGETTVTVTQALEDGYKYMYQVGETITAPDYNDDVSSWADMATNPDDIATTNSYIIGVALVDETDEQVLAYGEAAAVVA